MAGAVFRDLGVSLFVAGAVFGEIWVDSRSAKCCNFQYKMRCRGGKVSSANGRVQFCNFIGHFDVLRKNLDTAINVASLTDEQKRRGTFLYGLLASLLRNRPLMMLKGADRGNGFEAVRQLFRTCQPSSRNRGLGLLHVLMRWPEFDMKVAMLPQILKLEDSFREYERIGGLLSGELKFAVLMKSIGGQFKTYLNMTIQESTTYDSLRESILQYDQATVKWSSAMALGTSMQSGDEPTPMEVDRICKGKGKGKDKGKNDKGKGRLERKGQE